MPVAITMKDVLEPVICDEDFAQTIQALNMAAAKSSAFMVLDDMEGGHVGINIPNINLITEIEP